MLRAYTLFEYRWVDRFDWKVQKSTCTSGGRPSLLENIRQVPDFLECERRSVVTTCRVESVCRTNVTEIIIIIIIIITTTQPGHRQEMTKLTSFFFNPP